MNEKKRYKYAAIISVILGLILILAYFIQFTSSSLQLYLYYIGLYGVGYDFMASIIAIIIGALGLGLGIWTLIKTRRWTAIPGIVLNLAGLFSPLRFILGIIFFFAGAG